MAERNGNGRAEHRRRILVVDDSRDGANTLARMLKLMANDVRTANDELKKLLGTQGK